MSRDTDLIRAIERYDATHEELFEAWRDKLPVDPAREGRHREAEVALALLLPARTRPPPSGACATGGGSIPGTATIGFS